MCTLVSSLLLSTPMVRFTHSVACSDVKDSSLSLLNGIHAGSMFLSIVNGHLSSFHLQLLQIALLLIFMYVSFDGMYYS